MKKKSIQNEILYKFFYGLVAVFLIAPFIFDNPSNVFNGFIRIIRTQEVLLTDYFKVGGFGATSLNVGLVTLLTLLMMKYNKIKMSSLAFTSLLTLIGFAFFGKNIYNIVPIYFGVYLYSLFSKEPYKNYFLVAVFSTCLAPLIGANFLDNIYGVFLSIFLGIVYGFVIVPLASHMMKFHNGYTLYNVGFAGGMYAVILASVLRTLGIELETVNLISAEYHVILAWFIALLSIVFIVGAIFRGDFSFSEYNKLCQRSGRAVTDYFSLFKSSTVFFNVGLMGLISLIIVLISGIPINGPIVGAILTVMGFATFGVSPKNSLIVIFGCTLMFLISGDTMKTEEIITILFVVGIAPIAGKYGIVWGLAAGMLHYSVVNFSSAWQGAINLYNNGFASGIVAGVVVNIVDNFRKVE